MSMNIQEQVGEQRAAVLLGLPTTEIRRFSRLAGLGHLERVTEASRWFSPTTSCSGSAYWPRSLRSNRHRSNASPRLLLTPPSPGCLPTGTRGLPLRVARTSAFRDRRKSFRVFFLELQLARGFVLLEERTQLRHRLQQPDPLFVVKSHRKAPQSVHAHASFFTDTKLQRTGTASASLFFHFREFCFQFFVSWLCHGVSSV